MKTQVRKILALGLVFTMVLTLLVGLSSQAVLAEEDTADAETEENTEDVESPDDATAAEDSPFEALMAYQFTLEGTDFSLPFPVEELLAAGWSFENDSDKSSELYNGTDFSSWVKFIKDDLEIRVTLRSFSEDPTTYEQSQVTAIGVSRPYNEDQAITNLSLPGDVNLDSAPEDFLAAYGEPHCLYSDGSTSKWGPKNDNNFVLSINQDKKMVKEITLTRFYFPEILENIDGEDVKTIYDVKDYRAPEEVGEKIVNLEFSLDDTPMSIPIPVSELLAKGWSVFYVSDDATELKPNYSTDLVLRKGKSFLPTLVYNLSPTETYPIENCLIGSVKDKNRDGINYQNHLQIAQGLEVGSERRDVVLLLIDLKPETSISGSTESYRVKFASSEGADIIIDNDLVTEISLWSRW